MITSVLIIATGVFWLVWDIYVYATGQKTISEKLYTWSKDITVTIPHSFGFLCGHWFQKGGPGDLGYGTYAIILTTAFLLLLDLFNYLGEGKGFTVRIYKYCSKTVIFTLGYILGTFLF